MLQQALSYVLQFLGLPRLPILPRLLKLLRLLHQAYFLIRSSPRPTLRCKRPRRGACRRVDYPD